ncbi:hypothetical protein LVJ94_35170 [Pendulispora rubella]|uniref:Uncharacterized protein n=1 Tax=Pendulispora rubella TaxID=2741070 RepID=A0ABZ2KXV7_9BACT
MDTGSDAAIVDLAYEVAQHSFAWDPALTERDHERVIVGLLWSVGNRELSAEEWTERMEALQEQALREIRAAAEDAEDSVRGVDE